MVPLIAFPLILIGVVALFGGALWLSWRLPRVRLDVWTRRLVTVALFVPAVPVMMWSSAWASKAVVIVLAYGYDAYAAGLWIINKRGDLTDGGNLGDFWNGVWGALMFLSFVWPILPLVVFRFVTDDYESRGADTGEAHYRRGQVRQRHGHYAEAREDYQAAVAHFTSYLEY